MNKLSSNLPTLDMSTSTTGCCPKFDPAQWDNKLFEFHDKPFLKDQTVSFLHIPLNMSKVMARMQKLADENNAIADDFILLSQEVSSWHADQYYAISQDIPNANIVRLSGKYFSKVYEGEFRDAGKWHQDLIDTLKERGDEVKQLYFYYTTCPKCAKVYDKNYVVGFAQIG